MINWHLNTFPKVQCLCGCSSLVLKRDFNDEKKISFQICRCNGKGLCVANANKGCLQYLKWIRVHPIPFYDY